MTEQEAIQRIQDHFRVHDDGRPTPYLDEAVNMATDLLKLKSQNRIIELPMPIGSIVYGISSRNEVEKFMISIHFPLGFLRSLMIVWGKEVFATREEAEARLKELRNEQTDVH